jgi:hypothetical protein
MSSPVRAHASHSPKQSSIYIRSHSLSRRTIILIISGTSALFLIMFLASREWPFSEESIAQRLSEASDSSISVHSFRRSYFPFPGCVLDGVVFRRGSRNRTFISIDKLVVQGSYFQLLRRHVPRIIANGAHIFVAPAGQEQPFNTKDSNSVVEELLVHDSVVDFLTDNPRKAPARFLVHEASFHDLKFGNPFTYNIKAHNPNPPGEIAIHGKIGTLKHGRTGETPVSGEYTFEHADLSVYHGIAGMLSSTGKFNGTLGHMDVSGATEVPNFTVESSGHTVRLGTNFDAYVDATRGDTFLRHVEAQWGHTLVEARGSVASGDGRKVGRFDFSVQQGRIEDLLILFVKEERSPMSGPIALKAHAEIPPGKEEFLTKITMSGTFDIERGRFTKPRTQNDLDQLSAGARGENKEDAERVLTNLNGEVNLEDGIAQFSHIGFDVPGAAANLHGKYNIVNHRVDLHGQMKVDTRISKTTSGVKSFLLKILDPFFFKKRRRGELVPVHVMGTYEHPDFGLDLKKPDK